MSKIYLASSWRNLEQPHAVKFLRERGHEVYDFKNPPGGTGFAWGAIDPEWKTWSAHRYIQALKHPLALAGYYSDFGAMQWADVCILLLPCGRSAHLELGYMAGAGKKTFIVTRDGEEPELMALMATRVVTSIEQAALNVERGA